MDAVDFLLIRSQQSFKEGKQINPTAIKIENNKLQNMFEKHKKDKTKFKLTGLLFQAQ